MPTCLMGCPRRGACGNTDQVQWARQWNGTSARCVISGFVMCVCCIRAAAAAAAAAAVLDRAFRTLWWASPSRRRSLQPHRRRCLPPRRWAWHEQRRRHDVTNKSVLRYPRRVCVCVERVPSRDGGRDRRSNFLTGADGPATRRARPRKRSRQTTTPPPRRRRRQRACCVTQEGQAAD